MPNNGMLWFWLLPLLSFIFISEAALALSSFTYVCPFSLVSVSHQSLSSLDQLSTSYDLHRSCLNWSWSLQPACSSSATIDKFWSSSSYVSADRCARSSLPWLLQRPWPARRGRPRLRHRRHGSPPYHSTLHCSVGRDHGWFFKPQVGSTVSNKNYTVEKRNSSAFHWTQKIFARSVKERQSYRSSKSSGF